MAMAQWGAVSLPSCAKDSNVDKPASAGTHIDFDGVFCDWLLWDELGRNDTHGGVIGGERGRRGGAT